MVTPDEMTASAVQTEPKPIARTLKAADVAKTLAKGGPSTRETGTAPRFKTGDRVRTANINPTTHTRLPRYARGKIGTVELLHGVHVFPDTNSQYAGEEPQHLYTVRFTGVDLWGAGCRTGHQHLC